MITYADARKALEIMDEAFAKAFGQVRPKARIVGMNELEPVNRKERRIAASKARRKKNVSNGTRNGIEFAHNSRGELVMGQDVVESEQEDKGARE